MKSRLGRLAGAAPLAAAVAAGVLTVVGTADPAHAVAGGTSGAAGTFPYVAKVDIGDGTRACSGALVAREWILTATSCFSIGGQQVTAGRPPAPTTVYIGRADLTGTTGGIRMVTSVVPHASRDVVLARLSRPVSEIVPIRLAAGKPAAADDTLRLAGYGRTATDWVPNVLQTGQVAVKSVGDTSFTVAASDAATTCQGDAGGPAFRETSTGAELVGINATSGQGGCLGATSTDTTATEIRADDLGDWITQTIRQGEPIGRWDMNDTAGTTLADTNPVGTSHPATVTGGALLGQDGPVLSGDKAVHFDGVNDAAATTGPVINTSADYTISTWVRVGALGTTYINAVSADGATTSLFGLGKNAVNQWTFWTHSADNASGGTLVQAAAAIGPTSGKWTHLTGVFTAADRKLQLYVNGGFAASAFMSTPPVKATGPLAIGRGWWKATGGYYWNGDISQVKTWNRALTGNEIAALPATLVGRWGMQAGGADTSGYNRALTATSDVTYDDGHTGFAAIFNGTTTATATAGPALRTDQSFTVSAWVRADTLTAAYTNAIAADGTTTSPFGLGLNSGNKWTFWLHTADSASGGTLIQSAATAAATAGQWTHLDGVYDTNNHTITLYVNGTPAAATTVATPLWNATGPFTVGKGKWQGNSGYLWNGAIDEVQTFQGAMTAPEIQRLAQ